MRNLISLVLISVSVNVHADQCYELRRKILAMYIEDLKAPDISAPQDWILDNIESFYNSPVRWVQMCGDTYEEGDSSERGYKLCRKEARICDGP